MEAQQEKRYHIPSFICMYNEVAEKFSFAVDPDRMYPDTTQLMKNSNYVDAFIAKNGVKMYDQLRTYANIPTGKAHHYNLKYTCPERLLPMKQINHLIGMIQECKGYTRLLEYVQQEKMQVTLNQLYHFTQNRFFKKTEFGKIVVVPSRCFIISDREYEKIKERSWAKNAGCPHSYIRCTESGIKFVDSPNGWMQDIPGLPKELNFFGNLFDTQYDIRPQDFVDLMVFWLKARQSERIEFHGFKRKLKYLYSGKAWENKIHSC